jgi:hypothetical protein
VWGIWRHELLHLSIGSPVLARDLGDDGDVTVHLDSGTDVVVVEGAVNGTTADADAVDAYVAKYGRPYDIGEHGPLTVVAPTRILAWRADGWAGRDGFAAAGRWDRSG